ncbi:uncharacterized protein LOC115888821 [Sitophilus oryzae]|uniref:Uncharacterized protein LOC115888821 n=1 Tax=Sitophilus oryzae TaxID=7048 RepID=A0A6J2YMN9_SITOR|nr:uncharacterized protein LOC115888821 [Sitophilus oryzae]
MFKCVSVMICIFLIGQNVSSTVGENISMLTKFWNATSRLGQKGIDKLSAIQEKVAALNNVLLKTKELGENMLRNLSPNKKEQETTAIQEYYHSSSNNAQTLKKKLFVIYLISFVIVFNIS